MLSTSSTKCNILQRRKNSRRSVTLKPLGPLVGEQHHMTHNLSVPAILPSLLQSFSFSLLTSYLTLSLLTIKCCLSTSTGSFTKLFWTCTQGPPPGCPQRRPRCCLLYVSTRIATPFAIRFDSVCGSGGNAVLRVSGISFDLVEGTLYLVLDDPCAQFISTLRYSRTVAQQTAQKGKTGVNIFNILRFRFVLFNCSFLDRLLLLFRIGREANYLWRVSSLLLPHR